jgi:hypothetical protein
MSEPPKEKSAPAESVSRDAQRDEVNVTPSLTVKGYPLARKPRPRKGEPEANNQTHWSKTMRHGAVRWLSNGRRSAQ